MRRTSAGLMLFVVAWSVSLYFAVPVRSDFVKTIIYDGQGFVPGGIAIGNIYLPPKPALTYIYCVQGENEDLVAWSYHPSSPQKWHQHVLLSGVAYEGITIGQGRNDGTDRLYCIKNDQLWEVWSKDTTSTPALVNKLADDQWVHVVIASGRNDGVNRVYASTRQEKIYEFTYDRVSGQWLFEIIDLGMKCDDIGAGRNDGVNRIYGVGGDDDWTICELTYDDIAGWHKTDAYSWIWEESSFPANMSDAFLAPARGEHDGRKLHIYYLDPYREINELTYESGTWTNKPVDAGTNTENYYGPGIQEWGRSFDYGELWHQSRPTPDRLLWTSGVRRDLEPEYTVYVFGFAYDPVTQEWIGYNAGAVGIHGACVRIGDVRKSADYALYAITVDGKLVELYLKEK